MTWALTRCRLGWHRWQNSTTAVELADGTVEIVDRARCANPTCAHGRDWMIVNVERRRPFVAAPTKN